MRRDVQPVSTEDWERRARQTLPAEVFDYFAGGAGGEGSLRANVEAFHEWRLRPRVLAGVEDRDLRVKVLGTHSAAPFFLGPISALTQLDEEGEVAVARAAAATGVPMVLATGASRSLEDVASALGETHGWFQLHWLADRDVVASLMRRAEAAGYRAVVVTVDTAAPGWREREVRAQYLPFVGGHGLGQFSSDPVIRERLGSSADDPGALIAALAPMYANPGATWEDARSLSEQTSLPLLAKGVLTREDAQLALDSGFDGIIVSNHGGRQLDGAVATLDALVEVRESVGDDAVVLMDGGVRRAADVLKAVALGADAVLLGRAYAFALGAGGQSGVEQLLRNLTAELDVSLAMLGARTIDAVGHQHVVRRGRPGGAGTYDGAHDGERAPVSE